MKIFWSQHRVKYRPLGLLLSLLIFTTVRLSPDVFAEELPEEKKAIPSAEQIQIVADKLVTDSADKFAEFMGDVRASQGNFIITSEYLRIYYKDDLQQDSQRAQSGSQGLIKQVVASGNVKVSFEGYTVETQRVEYDPDTQIAVLTGENSTMTSGKNVLTGSKITVNRRNGQIHVEGGPEQRVRAVFHPEEEFPEENSKEP